MPPPLSMSKPPSNIPLSAGGGGLEPPDDAQATSISWAAIRQIFQIFMTMSSTARHCPAAGLNGSVKLDKSILSLAHSYSPMYDPTPAKHCQSPPITVYSYSVLMGGLWQYENRHPASGWPSKVNPNAQRVRKQFATKGEALAFERFVLDPDKGKPWLEGQGEPTDGDSPIWLNSGLAAMARACVMVRPASPSC
jgi:hypothetical protein